MKIVRIVAIALLAATLLWLVPSEKVIAEGAAGQIIQLPLDTEVGLPVYDKYYVSDLSYQDPSIHVNITSGRAYDTDYLVVHIRIATASQLRSHVEKTSDGEYADKQAKRVNAVVAITGDNYRTNQPNYARRYIIRQGQEKFIQNWSGNCFYDILMIDDQGDFHVLQSPTRQECDDFVASHNVINSYCFGPALIINGEVQPKPTDSQKTNGVGWSKDAQRLAICQVGPLEYVVVVTGGPDNPGSNGITIDEFNDIILSECTPTVAYNLDGGNSAWLVFKNEKLNMFGRTGSQGKRRVEDILYFITCWQE